MMQMFKKLTDFGYKRTTKQAIGFYIAYLILIALAGGLIGGLYGLVSGNDSYETGMSIGIIIGTIICLGISIAIIKKKKKMNDFKLILIAVLSGVLALLGGGVVGLIPAAYLSTR